MSSLAKDLLTQYYGLGAETSGLRFLSIHQSVENIRKEEEKQVVEQITTTFNEDIIYDEESEKDVDDEQKLTTANDSNRRPSKILVNFVDAHDTNKQLEALNIDFAPNIFYNSFENATSTLRDESYCEIAQNTARSTIDIYETETNDARDEYENDLNPTVVEDSILDNCSEVSLKVEEKSRVPTKSSSKNSIHLPPLEPKKSPVCNETFADFSRTDLKEFPAEILIGYRHLRMLYLSNNELTDIPDVVFATLKYLEWLDVRNNRLTSLSAAVIWHPCLETILLQGNKLECLPLELCTLPNLHTFQVTQNPLISPPEDIVASGSAAILDYLRLEWNKTHPEKRIEPKKNRIEPKLSTILCYQSPRKGKKKLAPLKNPYHNKVISTRERRKLYRPSNRCENKGANILLENRAIWFSKAKEVLAKQAAIVQKMKDTSVLKDWRQDKRSYGKAIEKARNRNEDDIPFGCDFDDYASIFKQNSKSKNFGPKRKRGSEFRPPKDINRKINELLESLNKLEINITGETTPRTKQYMFKDEIEKILQFQYEIQNLRKYNEVGTVSLRN